MGVQFFPVDNSYVAQFLSYSSGLIFKVIISFDMQIKVSFILTILHRN